MPKNHTKNVSTDNMCCFRCKTALSSDKTKILDDKIYCNSCFNFHLQSDNDVPADRLTYITCIGGSYSGDMVYYDHDSKKLIGHSYMFHLDDGQDFSGWFDISLEKVLRDLMSNSSLKFSSKEMKLLNEFFGSEIAVTIENIRKNG